VNDEFVLYYHDIFAKFTENYWNLILKYHLKQMRPDGKSEYSSLEKILRQSKETFAIPDGVPFDSVDPALKEVIISKVQKDCKRNVIGALYEDFEGFVYGFDLKHKDYLVLHPVAYQFMMKYKMELEKLNYYAWAKFLENINEENLLCKVISKLETSLPVRKPLDIFRKILFEEFEQNNCFYCGKKLSSIAIHVDHFIPWSFVSHDLLWNLMPADSSINSSKSNKLPDLNLYLPKLAEAHQAALRINLEKGKQDKLLEDYLSLGHTPQDIASMEREHLLDCFSQTFTPMNQIALNMGFESWKY
jgi:hypothetical protein